MSQLRRDMSGTLLRPEQEIALARRIHGDDVTVPGPGKSRPSPDEAIHRLVEQNLRLVMWVANRYRDHGLPIEDLVQEGAIGLQRAAERFDPERGCRFATYAIWWIKQAIGRALSDTSRTIRVPESVLDRVSELRDTERRLTVALGRPPTTAEIATAAGVSERDVVLTMDAVATAVSLDRPLGEDGTTIGEVIADGEPTPEEQIADGSLRDDVSMVLDGLPELERKVLSLRYGLGDKAPYTVVEVGRMLNLSRERVYQLEGSALHRLRRDRSVLRLRAYLA
jgi:RNA polymerase sigma factor (sigma-70 family)